MDPSPSLPGGDASGSELALLAQQAATLTRLGVLAEALRTALIEQALRRAAIPLPPDEQLQRLVERFWRQQRLAPGKRDAWLQQRRLSPAEIAGIASRPLRWSHWCRQRWEPSLEALFLRYKPRLDRATALLLELEDPGLARELYLRLVEGEASFRDLSQRYCRDHPQRRGVQLGPTPLSALPPPLAELIRTTAPQKVRGPVRLAPERWAILRVEEFESASLNDPSIPPRLFRLEGEAQLQRWMTRWLQDLANGGSPPADPTATTEL